VPVDNQYCDYHVWDKPDEYPLWVLDKLLLSKRLGYTCGPAGVPVPEPGEYIVRPCVNVRGMGEGAQIMHIERDTDHLPAGTFWCKVFAGEHWSVDYLNNFLVKSVRGFRDDDAPLWKWRRWELGVKAFSLPDWMKVSGPLNVEFVDEKIIEVHFRHNPDFRWGNGVAVPVYDEPRPEKRPKDCWYVDDPDGPRLGFWIR